MIKQNELVPKRRFKGYTSEWRLRKWIETVDISTNMVDPKNGNYDELFHIGPGNIESFTGRVLDNVKKVKDENLISGKFYFKRGDVIYGKINPQLGKYVLSNFDGLASADAYVLNTKNEVLQDFLYRILQTSSFYKYSVSVSSRTGMPKINRNELNQYSFWAPLLEEQKKIGQFFKHLDEMIAIQQRKIDKTKALKSAYLAEMFPAEGEHVPKRRFAGFTDEWEKNDLGKLGIIQSGIGFPEKDQGGKKGIPFIKVSDMNIPGNEIELIRTNHYVNQKKIDEKRWHPITETPALIFAKVGAAIFLGRKRLINRPFLIDNNMMSYAFNSFWDINFGKILFEKLNLSRYAQVGALPSLSASDIANIRISIPTKKEQQKIGQFFKHLDEMIATHQLKLDKLKATKQAYLHEMFV